MKLSSFLPKPIQVANKFLFASFLIVWLLPLVGNAQIKLGSAASKIEIDYLQPKEYEIGGIEVRGVKFLDPENLISLTGLKVGDKLTIPSEKTANAIKKLWEVGILGDVEINILKVEGNVVFLALDLKERPRLSKFTIRGVRKGEQDDLREKISLIRGRVVTDALIKNSQTTIKKFFIDKGYLNAKVAIRQIADSSLNNSVILAIDIAKGKKVKIEYIDVQGNEAFKDNKVKSRLKNTKERKWWRVWKASKFIRTEFDEDKDKLLAFYNKEGFRDAEIKSDSIVRLKDNRVGIILNVDEGKKYYFRNIYWTGNYLYTDKILGEILGVKKGDVYNQETLNRKLQFNQNGADVSSLYMDDGYLFFNAEPVEVAVEGDSIDIEVRINEGAQATINKITVAGNTKTNDKVILRELRTLPGQKFSRADLIRSQSEIARLGYFDPEKIGINPVPNPQNGTVDINYTVEERPSDQVEVSGGWGGFFGFVGTVGLTFNNFSIRKVPKLSEWQPLPGGDGQRLSLRVQANGIRFQTYSASFTEPWLGGKKPTSFTVALSHSVQRNLFAGAPSSLNLSNASVSIGKRVKWPDDFFTMLFTANINRYTLNNFNFPELVRDPSTGLLPNLVATNFNITTTFARNSINNPTFPSAGSSLSLQVSLTPPYSFFRDPALYKGSPQDRFRYVEYHKWMFDASYFIPIAKNLVLNTRAHFGFLGNYNRDIEVGPFERFKLGGAGLAGFNFLLGYDIVGLRGYQDAIVFNQRRTPGLDQAGVIFNKYVTELRYAITTNPNATIFVLGFFEAGNNYLARENYNPFKVYRAAGVGARIFMPAFGLIGIDWGRALDNLPGEPGGGRQAFTFTIGQQIR